MRQLAVRGRRKRRVPDRLKAPIPSEDEPELADFDR